MKTKCKKCNKRILGYKAPDLCNKCKPMQNNETKWEQDFQMKYCGELYKQEVSEDFRGFRGCYQEVKDFISQEIEKAYQKGKEETLEELEKVIRKIDFMDLYLKYKNNPVYTITDEIMWSMKSEILQTLNKMKEK